MTWFPDDPQGFESDKVRFDILPYCARGGIDIGCGPKKVWPHMIGIDSGKDTQLFGIPMKPDIVIGNAERLALFADNAFECVFSSHTLEHIDHHLAALNEWWRIVKPGGYLILYLPHLDLYPNIGQPGANPDHKHDFINEDIIEAMSAIAPDWTLLVNEKRDQGFEYSFLQVFRKEPAGTGQRQPWCHSRPEKTVGLVRIGAKGDALWASSPVAQLKKQGYHVTVYCAHTGEEMLRHDPNIDRIIMLPDGVLSDDDLLSYWAHEAVKYDRWINLIGSVEKRLLYHPSSNEFFLSQELRHRFGNHNYLEMIHDYAGLPHDFSQKYYPTDAEKAWAAETRGRLPDGPLVIINPVGSGPAKTWPHTQRLIRLLADAGVVSVVLGDLRDMALNDIEPYAHVVGMEWPVRAALAFALQSDAVVATESMIANTVAFESMLKVIMLSHSNNENLTKHWLNTVALEPNVSCHPCHRIHASLAFCSKDTNTGTSACMASASPELIAELVIKSLDVKRSERQAA